MDVIFIKKDNKYPNHYSGNFFWVNSNHLKKLNIIIEPEYHAPEFWLFNTSESFNYFDAYSTGLHPGAHYERLYPAYLYKL